MRKLFHGISRMWGVAATNGVYSCGSEMAQVEGFSDAWMAVDGGRIVALGGDEGSYGDAGIGSRFSGLKASDRNSILVSLAAEWSAELVDLGGVEVLPGLVDSHTHIVFAAPRHEEFEMRIKGESYEAIAAAGGGILNSARKLQAMDEDLLYEQAAQRLRVMILHGTTAVEIKSGYGLTVDAELKMLRVIKRIKAHLDIPIKTTFLAAHALPEEFRSNKQGFIQVVVDQWIPKVISEGLADYIDLFCSVRDKHPHIHFHLLLMYAFVPVISDQLKEKIQNNIITMIRSLYCLCKH